MAQLIVRNLDESTKANLKRRAERNGRSVEEEVRHILRLAARAPKSATNGLGTKIAARFSKTGLREPLPEMTGQTISPPDFLR